MKKSDRNIKIKQFTAAFLAFVMICLSGADALPGGGARHAAVAEIVDAAFLKAVSKHYPDWKPISIGLVERIEEERANKEKSND